MSTTTPAIDLFEVERRGWAVRPGGTITTDARGRVRATCWHVQPYREFRSHNHAHRAFGPPHVTEPTKAKAHARVRTMRTTSLGVRIHDLYFCWSPRQICEHSEAFGVEQVRTHAKIPPHTHPR